MANKKRKIPFDAKGLKHAIKESGMTAKEFCEKTEMTYSNYKCIMSTGEIMPDTLEKATKIFGRKTDPLVIRINKFLTDDDYRYVSRKLKQDNPNIIILPAYCEVLHPQIIRCKDCHWHYGTLCRKTNTTHWNDDDFCSHAEREDE